MWTIKFTYDGSKQLYGSLTKKHHVAMKGYNLSNWEKSGNFYVTSVGDLIGEEKNIKRFIDDLKKSKYYINLEENNSFMILTIKEDKPFKPFYSPMFIFLSPALIEEGKYFFHVASWSRKEIEILLKQVENFPGFKLLSFKQEKITNISITGIQPNLTDKQRTAYELAVNKGYYEYPKKITLKELARLLKISYSTFQQHISYAEKKIGNYVLGKIPA
jgi:predicted DNA binding protein